jgi:hypothetical protein
VIMKAPRVTALHYRIIPGEDCDFDRSPPIEFENDEFHGRLADYILTLFPVGSFAAADAAADAAMPFIRAWEIKAGVKYQSATEFQIVFTGAEVEDTAAPQGTLSISLDAHCHVAATATSHASRSSYPPPAQETRLLPEVEAIWARVSRYIDRREPLTSVAYFVLTVLTMRRGVKEAAIYYRIGGEVLRRISELSSTRGDALTARKLTKMTVPLAPEETQWLHDALFGILRHLLDFNSGSTFGLPSVGSRC